MYFGIQGHDKSWPFYLSLSRANVKYLLIKNSRPVFGCGKQAQRGTVRKTLPREKRMDFNALHQQNQPLLLANVWDASSAQAAQQAGYQALGSSSAAIAAMLGYEDGEEMSFDELFYVVSRIKTVSELPLSVDLEAGYGATTSHIIDNIRRLAHLGVSGINLEDSHVVDGTRRLDDAERFAVKLQKITRAYPGLFVNVRTDTFLLNVQDALVQTLYRGQLYAKHGACGFFVPCVTRAEDIIAIVHHVRLPLNVMCMPELADFSTLSTLGVKRISMGNFIYAATQARLKDLLCQVQTQHSFSGVF